MFFGILLGLFTSVCWALGNVFIQRSGRALGGPRALTWALALGAALSGLAALGFDRRSAPISGPALAWVAVSGSSGLVAYAGLFYAFSRAKLSLAVPFVTCWSIIAGVISIAVFGQAVRPGQVTGALIVVLGVILVSTGAAGSHAGDAPAGPGGGVRPLAAALVSGITFGLMVPTMAHVTPVFGLFGTATVVYLLGLVLAIPLALALGIDLSPPPRSAWGVVAGAGVFETLGFVALNAAGRFAPVAVVAPVASLAAAFTVLYAAIVLHERPGRLALSGAILASLGVVVLAL